MNHIPCFVSDDVLEQENGECVICLEDLNIGTCTYGNSSHLEYGYFSYYTTR